MENLKFPKFDIIHMVKRKTQESCSQDIFNDAFVCPKKLKKNEFYKFLKFGKLFSRENFKKFSKTLSIEMFLTKFPSDWYVIC